MINITGDEYVIRYARFLESISPSEGARFLYGYIDKKNNGNLLVKKFPCVYQYGEFVIRYEDFSIFLKLEDLLERIEPIFLKFFYSVRNASENKIQKEATDIRGYEKDIYDEMINLNKILNYKDIGALYKDLYAYFPKGKESHLEKKMITLTNHFEKYGTRFQIKGLYSLFDLIDTVDFFTLKRDKLFVL